MKQLFHLRVSPAMYDSDRINVEVLTFVDQPAAKEKTGLRTSVQRICQYHSLFVVCDSADTSLFRPARASGVD